MKVEELRQQLAELHEESTADEAWYIITAALKRACPPHRAAMVEWVVLWLGQIWDWRASEVTRITTARLALREYPHMLPALISHLVRSPDSRDRIVAVEVVVAIHTSPDAPDPHAYDDLLLPLLTDEWPAICFDTCLLLWRQHPVLVRAALDRVLAGRYAAYWRQRLAEEGRDRAELDGVVTGDG